MVKKVKFLGSMLLKNVFDQVKLLNYEGAPLRGEIPIVL